MDTMQKPPRSVGVSIEDLRVSFGAHHVLERLSLEVRAGEFLVLLGPSGCGKSTLLNAVAGLQDTSGGTIRIAGRDVTGLEPSERGIAMVFQSYALYPTMDVRSNLSFGLKVAKVPREEIERRVAHAAEVLELTPYLKRKPAALSGGQRQRVAIGRALVRDVGIFLFDEPLSNLDAQLRAELRVEIKRLHARLGNTMIYVTHDQIEALTLADRIAVMRDGVIQQLDAPETVYDAPKNLFVARFLGSPAMNFIEGDLVVDAGRPVFRNEAMSLPLPSLANTPQTPRKVTLGIRPERIALGAAAEHADVRWQAPVELREPLGGDALVWCFLGRHRLCAKTGASFPARAGENVPAGLRAADICLFDRESGERL